MSIDISQFYEVFFEETAEHLASMEDLLLKLDANAPDGDALNAIFRAAHSIKGGSGTFGFTDMASVTHFLEDALGRLRNGELALRQEMIDIFLRAADLLSAQLAFHRGGAPVDSIDVARVCATLSQMTGAAPPPASEPNALAPTESSVERTRNRFQLTFDHVEKTKLDALLEALARLGQYVAQQTDNNASQTVVFETTLDEADLRETLEFVVSPQQIALRQIHTRNESHAAQTPPLDEGFGFFVTEAELRTLREAGQGIRRIADAPGADVARNADARVHEKSDAVGISAERHNDRGALSAAAEASSIRVSVDKVDRLLNLVGELVISQAMLVQTAARVEPVLFERLMTNIAQLERNTRDLQESVMSIRMLPISFVFNRFPRLVRDVASKLGKQVELVTVGEGTELDRGLIEKISDPLTHLVRNSLDHGIESPEQRMAAGKTARGILTLRAAHQGGGIVIEVADDGAGLNRERILAKARERGLAVHDGLSDHEVWQLVFAPGLSTAETVTDVSGRGVGMDVVKRNIEGMGGRVELSSTPGQGAKIAIRLPLTLAILEGMSVAVGDEIFIIPLTFIVESLQPAADDVRTISGNGRMLKVRGEYLPLVAMHRLFNIHAPMPEPHQGIVVIVESDIGRIALLIDTLLGQHQVVIKSLEDHYRKVNHVAGATIMGDGRVALIVDVAALVRGNPRPASDIDLSVAA